MRYVYPCILTPEASLATGFAVSFPDVPEVLANGADTAASLELAEDALATALAKYVKRRREIPEPSPQQQGQYLVPLPLVTAAKIALYRAMRAQGVTKVALAKQLGVTESAVRKLTDLNHRSHIDQVARALRLLGRILVVGDMASH